MKLLFAIGLIIMLTVAASANLLLLFPGGGGGSGAQSTGKLLLVDGVSFVLKVDAASKICLSGGC